MEMKRKIKTTTPIFYCYFCSRHILITFVGMTLLIVNYGVNTVQMSAVPHRNGNCNSISISGSGSGGGSGNNVVSFIKGDNLKNKNNLYNKILWKRSVENITNINSNRNTNTNLLHIPQPALPTAYRDNLNVDSNYYNFRLDSSNNAINHTGSDLVARQFENFRKSRIFGLLGTNFSLSYNLSLATGNSVGNITVTAPAPVPTYYYAPAAYYPYGYGYYNPYAYNPYAYNPYSGYGYYK